LFRNGTFFGGADEASAEPIRLRRNATFFAEEGPLFTVAVTGVARGIGRAIGREFELAGWRVVVGDLDGEPALDVRDEQSFVEFLGAAGDIDVLVNNAGVVATGGFLETTAEEHALQLAVNLGGVARGMRLALPGMVARGRGRVVNIASAAGRVPTPGGAVYSATKHAVVALTDAVRSELRGTGVALTAVLPTAVRTEMAGGLAVRGLPWVSPEVVARAVVRAATRRRPPATVMVPGWLRPVVALDQLAPQALRDLARRLATARAPIDPTVRTDYQTRVSRQLPPS
jgi:short-subunit dehydrogenase